MKLFYYRKMAKKTQKEMADLIDITPQTYSLKELGKRPFKHKEMKKIRNYLSSKLNTNLTIDELFF